VATEEQRYGPRWLRDDDDDDPCLRPPFGGNPLECGDEIWRQKTRVLGLPDGEEIMTLAFFVLTQYRRVTDGQTDGHVAITITRASIASRG